MFVPAITVPEVVAESLLYFPADVCGLTIGELFIPTAQVAILDIPEMSVPDFSECPFYVPLPPPIYYASSAYPVYEYDSFSLSTTISGAELFREPINWETSFTDIFSMSGTLVEGNLRDVRIDTTIPAESFYFSTNLLEVSVRDAPQFSWLDKFSLSASIVGSTLRELRYLNTEVYVDSLGLQGNMVSGTVSEFRYLAGSTEEDKIAISGTILNGTVQDYRYLTTPNTFVDVS